MKCFVLLAIILLTASARPLLSKSAKNVEITPNEIE
jgi:hypothetical protein